MLKENNMNYHQSLMNFIINFFFLFASALALFLASLYAKFFSVFLFFFRSEAFFYYFSPFGSRQASQADAIHRVPTGCTAILLGVLSKLLIS